MKNILEIFLLLSPIAAFCQSERPYYTPVFDTATKRIVANIKYNGDVFVMPGCDSGMAIRGLVQQIDMMRNQMIEMREEAIQLATKVGNASYMEGVKSATDYIYTEVKKKIK